MFKLSCVCPTYNRPPGSLHLLSESVESFLRQTYPHKELIIVNDTPGQELVCESPGVRVVNLPRRFDSLGEKRNYGVEIASGEILLPWDDDDISLPTRLEDSARHLEGADYWNPQRSFFMDARGMHVHRSHGYCHNASAFTRAAWKTAGGYPPISGPEDAEMDRRLKSCGLKIAPPLPECPESWSYVYRWGVSPNHLSGRPDFAAHYLDIGVRNVIPGRFVIEPFWVQEYDEICKRR